MNIYITTVATKYGVDVVLTRTAPNDKELVGLEHKWANEFDVVEVDANFLRSMSIDDIPYQIHNVIGEEKCQQ